MRTQRNRKIQALVDNRVKIDKAKSEINVARIIAEFARSRTNVELSILLQNEIFPELLKTQRERLEEYEPDVVQWLKSEGHDVDNFVREDTFHDLAKIPYKSRKLRHRFFWERTTKLEFKRMNVVIQKYLVRQSYRTPVHYSIKDVLEI